MRRILWELRKLYTSPVLIGLLLLFLAIDVGLAVSSQSWMLRGEAPDFGDARLLVDAQGYADAYRDFDLNAHAEAAICILGDVPEGARDLMRWKYQLLAPRVRQLAETGEGSAITVNELFYPLRTLLYGTLLQAALLQTMALAALMAAMGMDYENSSRASGIVYATRRGRKLLRDKLGAAAFGAVGAYLVLAIVSVAAFLWTYPVARLAGAPVSAALNKADYGIFGWQLFTTWVPFTELTYLLASLAVGVGLVCVAVLLAFAMGALISNSYVALGVTALAFVLPLLVGLYSGGWLRVFATYSPVYQCQLVRYWFSDGYYYVLFPWFETGTVATWLLITGALAALGARWFKGVDLCA